MKDPYAILGIPQGADDATLREAYRRLARDYEGNPRKLEEINNAYDSVILARGSGGYSAWQGSGSTQQAASPGAAWGQWNSAAAADDSDVRKCIQNGRFDDALTLLDGTPAGRRGAEWYYLKGCAQRGRGWLEEAEKDFRTAAEMAPGKREYRAAYDEMHSRRQGGYHTNRAGTNHEADDDKCCGICGGLLCADCCCECCF
jgi:curved DNA-binding protein CbpA